MVHFLYHRREFLAAVPREPFVQDILQRLHTYHLETYQHSCRTALLAIDLGLELDCTEEQMLLLARAGYVHDIGKLLEPESLLSAKRRLDTRETEVMHRHAFWTICLLRQASYDPDVIEIAGAHHEWQRDPYPRHHATLGQQLAWTKEKRMSNSGRETLAQILALADHVDALNSKRSYKPPFPPERIETILYEDFTGDQSLIPVAMKRVS